MGILLVFTGLQSTEKGKSGIEQIELVMPCTDPEGIQIYPLLKAKIEKRLRNPPWHCRIKPDSTFCRKGKTHYIVHINLGDDFYAAGMDVPGPGPFVIIEAALEEGDS
jgi:hypothetical protein